MATYANINTDNSHSSITKLKYLLWVTFGENSDFIIHCPVIQCVQWKLKKHNASWKQTQCAFRDKSCKRKQAAWMQSPLWCADAKHWLWLLNKLSNWIIFPGNRWNCHEFSQQLNPAYPSSWSTGVSSDNTEPAGTMQCPWKRKVKRESSHW